MDCDLSCQSRSDDNQIKVETEKMLNCKKKIEFQSHLAKDLDLRSLLSLRTSYLISTIE